MAAYTDDTKVAAYLGVTLTAPQITQAGILAQAASDWIDEYKGRSWQGASPVADELHTVYGDRVFLNHRPVTAVSAVKTRGDYADADLTTLTTGQYELIDAANGVLLIQGWAVRGGLLALVTYTHTATTPPTMIGLAATIIAASWLGPTMVGLPSGLESVALGQNDINVKFSKDARDVPAEALTLLGGSYVVIA